ncbi:MAG TPA: deoxyribonuclease V [Pseudonocardiaceae bacterium]|nr:deoxyribonuclease V [Pseudonocardiaceae bacterium]
MKTEYFGHPNNVLSSVNWPRNAAEAQQAQRELAAKVRILQVAIPAPATVAGLDVSYSTDSEHMAAAVVVVDVHSGRIIEESVAEGFSGFPYIPGLLAFREVPILQHALGRLRSSPNVLLCDGQGLAHPRRCGIACHIGVLTGFPTIGCAKTWLIGEYDEPGPQRGDRTTLLDTGELVGHVLRTQDGVKPVYVSPGHRISFDQSCALVLQMSSKFRLPDPIRHADQLSRRALQG